MVSARPCVMVHVPVCRGDVPAGQTAALAGSLSRAGVTPKTRMRKARPDAAPSADAAYVDLDMPGEGGRERVKYMFMYVNVCNGTRRDFFFVDRE